MIYSSPRQKNEQKCRTIDKKSDQINQVMNPVYKWNTLYKYLALRSSVDE